MTHPKGAGFGFTDPARRTDRKAYGEGVDEGGSGAASPFHFPAEDDPLHLHHRMDCPRCLDAGRDGDERGTVEVSLGVHLSKSRPEPFDPVLTLVMIVSPSITRNEGPRLECSEGCSLTDSEWAIVLASSFLDACRGYVDQARRRRRRR